MKKIILLLETSRAFGRQLIIGIACYSRVNGPWSFYKEPILIEKGFKNFAFCGFDDYDWSNERSLYFCRFNNKAGYNTHVYVQPKRIKKMIGRTNSSV